MSILNIILSWNWKVGKRYSMKMINKEYLYLLQKNQTLSKKIVTRQKRLLFNHKRISSPERYSNYIYSNTRASKYIKQPLKDLKEKKDSSTTRVDFNILFSITVRKFRQKINKEIASLNNTIDQIDLTDWYWAFCSAVPKYIPKFTQNNSPGQITC